VANFQVVGWKPLSGLDFDLINAVNSINPFALVFGLDGMRHALKERLMPHAACFQEAKLAWAVYPFSLTYIILKS
jgi:hypothetical protein